MTTTLPRSAEGEGWPSVDPPAGGEARTKKLPAEACGCSQIHAAGVEAALRSLPPSDLLIGIAELMKVFGDAGRLRILFALAAAELCVCDLAALIGCSQSAVSHQLALLRAARLVRSRRSGKSVFYSLDDSHVDSLLRLGLEHAAERSHSSSGGAS
ncbi:MAG TPA: metalloregulator ArsR/SmtB family transcription factor [Rectinemataceae bacterium]|nr:metalloregulator ArsR/SmtB family transcription factor [Rectinemataceae bacterium]